MAYNYKFPWSQIHKHTVSLRFLGIGFRVLKLEVSVYLCIHCLHFTLPTSFNPLLLKGAWGVKSVSKWIARRKTLRTFSRLRPRIRPLSVPIRTTELSMFLLSWDEECALSLGAVVGGGREMKSQRWVNQYLEAAGGGGEGGIPTHRHPPTNIHLQLATRGSTCTVCTGCSIFSVSLFNCSPPTSLCRRMLGWDWTQDFHRVRFDSLSCNYYTTTTTHQQDGFFIFEYKIRRMH